MRKYLNCIKISFQYSTRNKISSKFVINFNCLNFVLADNTMIAKNILISKKKVYTSR
jgi:hypothetical protein